MPKTANAARGEVALPESFGEGVFISFTVDALERLQSEYGEDYVEKIVEGTGKSIISVFKTVLSCAVVGDIEIDFNALQGNQDATRVAILDALFLSIHGRTVQEQMEKEEMDRIEEIGRQVKRMEEDPRLAEVFRSYSRYVGQDTEQASAQENSDT